MLESREDYEFVSQDALKRVQIDGMPYPVRPQKLIVKGEDEAYLREAIAERRFLCGLSVSMYTAAILRITQEVLRANWLYDAVEDGLRYGDWLESDAAEDYSVPSSPVVAMTGAVTFDRPQAADEAIADYEARIRNADAALAEALDDALDALVDDLVDLYDARNDAVREAEDSRDDAVADAEASLADDLAKMESSHDEALVEIEKDYGDGKIDASERDRLVAQENERYAWAVETRRDEAAKAVGEAEDACREATRSAEFTLYDSSKAKWAEYKTAARNAGQTHDGEVASARHAVNAAVASAELGVVYDLYLQIRNAGDSELEVRGDGPRYSDAVDEVGRSYGAMRITKSCLSPYLEKSPLTPSKPRTTASEVAFPFAVHAPSSDAEMRAFADLERMRCLSLTPPVVYRNAHTETIGDQSRQYPETRLKSYYRFRIVDDHQESGGNYDTRFSNTTFSVYYGRRGELDRITAVYATVAIVRDEYTTAFDEDEKVNRTYGYQRLQLMNEGVVAQTALVQIDAIRDNLAATLAHYAGIRDAAMAEADAAYLDALSAAGTAYDAAVADAGAELESALLDSAREMNDALIAAERSVNKRIANIEAGDSEDKDAQVAELLAEFSALKTGLNVQRAERDYEAQLKRDAAVAQAKDAQRRSDSEARDVRSRSYGLAREAYYESTSGLEDAAEDEIYEIKQQSQETVREDARCRWTFNPTPIDSDGLSLPSGEGANHRSVVWMAGIVHFDVVYEPRSLTGADFDDYYAELEDNSANEA